MRLLAVIACAILATLLGVNDGHTEIRVALVIGNSSYRNAPQLPNPANDAEALGLLLKSVGFAVVETHRDLGIAEMRRVINDFSDLTKNADTAVVFFAGHGIEVDGTNYLVPVDGKLARDLDVEDETISLDRILRILEPVRRFRLIILDACRDNPFANAMKRTFASRSVGRGLSRVEPALSDTLIAYAAKAGSTSADGEGIHSPFTTALLKHIATPGLDLRIALGRVRDEVLRATGNKQEPFVYGSLGGEIISLAAPTTNALVEPAMIDTEATAPRDFYAAVRVGTVDALRSFLVAHPTGFYADLAKKQLATTQPAKTKQTKLEKSYHEKKQQPSGGFGTSCSERKRWVRTVMRNTGGDTSRMTNPSSTLEAFAMVKRDCGGL